MGEEEGGERGMEEPKKTARPGGTDSDKETMNKAYPVGHLLLAQENPSLSGIPGRWVETTKVWIRTE